jgi:hypothetical protein
MIRVMSYSARRAGPDSALAYRVAPDLKSAVSRKLKRGEMVSGEMVSCGLAL